MPDTVSTSVTASRLLAVGLLALAVGACARPGKTIQALDDASHARIGVMTGSTGETVVRARFPEAEVKSFDDIMDAVAAIKSGQLDAAVTLYPAALQVAKKNPDLQLVPEALDAEDTAIAARKEDVELLAQVNAIIADLKADGTLDSMKKRWLKTDLGPYEEPEIVPPTTGTVLRVGVSATREPFSFIDANGRVTGHDGELARIIGFRLQRPVEFSNMKFMALIPALQSGKIDLIVTGMTATDERRKQVSFSTPYFVNAQRMIVHKPGAASLVASPAASGGQGLLSSQADLKDKRIGVLLGSAHDTYATKNYPQATILEYKTPSDVVLAVKTGKVDAALFDAEPLREIMRQDPSLGLLGDNLFAFDCGVGFSKGRPELRQQFNRFLADIRANGVYVDMVRRWMEQGATAMPELPAAATSGELVVGVSDVGTPFVMVKDNALVGFDVELAQRFAASLGRKAVFNNMEFGSLVASVATGKSDLIASAIYITDERRRQVDFSAPYYQMGTRVFALKEHITAYAAPAAAAPTARPSFLSRTAESFRSNILLERRYLLIWDGLKTTVVISIAATLLGTLLGALVCFMRMSRRALLNVPAKVYIAILRGTPVLVVLMLVFYVVFASVDISPVLVAVIAFGMNFAAYVAEIFRTGIEGVDKGQTEAGLAMGFGKVATFWYIVLPQTARRILPVYKGEFISLVKMTSIVGYIAVQDLTKASDIIRARTFDAFFPLVMVAILYFLIAWVLIQALDYVERVTDPKFRRRKAGRA